MLKWNTPGLKWNSPGLKWNGTAATPRKMSKTKATVDFSHYSAADLAPKAQNIHDKMTENAATFASPPVTMANLQAAITDYMIKMGAKSSRATADYIAANNARDTLEGMLADLGAYVNSVAKGDPAVVALSGFPFYDTAHVVDTTPPAAPADVRLSPGDVSGSIIVRFKPDRPRSMNEVQTCSGDPSLDANWHDAGTFSGGRADLAGLTVGAMLWVRVRTCGIKGVMGQWSDPAKITVV
jgi:hypothetical protein